MSLSPNAIRYARRVIDAATLGETMLYTEDGPIHLGPNQIAGARLLLALAAADNVA